MTCYQQWLTAACEGRVGRNGLVWLIEKIEPNVRTVEYPGCVRKYVDQAYPFVVEGQLIDGLVGQPETFRVREHFRWRVPSIDDPAYVITGTALLHLFAYFNERTPTPCPV